MPPPSGAALGAALVSFHRTRYVGQTASTTLGLCTSTVRVHLHSISTKVHVQTRTQAVLKYLGR
ncbi:MAG: hypothetical protein WD060_05270 [Pirellulales bacterium]